LTFKLRSVPAAADLPVYELSVPFFNKGSCELYLITLRHLGEVIVSQNINDAPGMYALARRVFKGDALATFNAAATIAGAETIANYQQAIQALTRHFFPCRAYSPVYKLSVPFFNKGSCELYLITLRHLGEIIVGQNINDAPGMYPLARRFFKGDALATFNASATIAGAETIANYQQAIRALTRHVFPRRAYATQKR
jgi:hypothetical protein